MLHPSIPPGEVPREWLETRAATSAELSGQYCAVTASQSLAALYPKFVAMALSLGLADFDAAALRDARPRQLTQAIAAWLYETTPVDGVPLRPGMATSSGCGRSSSGPGTLR